LKDETVACRLPIKDESSPKVPFLGSRSLSSFNEGSALAELPQGLRPGLHSGLNKETDKLMMALDLGYTRKYIPIVVKYSKKKFEQWGATEISLTQFWISFTHKYFFFQLLFHLSLKKGFLKLLNLI